MGVCRVQEGSYAKFNCTEFVCSVIAYQEFGLVVPNPMVDAVFNGVWNPAM